MLAAAGGGGTPWESMDLDTMQRLIQSASTEKQWEIVTGWKQSAELIGEHRFQVQDYRDNLAAAWPPDKSAASDAYITRLDEMIANLTETYEAALSNHDAFAAATGSIYQAQVKMEKIYQEYQNNKSALDAFTVKQQQAQNSPTPTPSPSPSGGEQPPVAPGRQEELRAQAAILLSGVSTDLAQAQVRIVKPTPYEQVKTKDVGPDGNDGNTYVAPPIPPITTSFQDESASSTRSTRPSTTFPTGTGTVLPATNPGVGVQQPGLILGGATPLPATPSTGIGLPPPSISGGIGGSPIGSSGLLPPGTGFLHGGNSSTPPPNARGVGSGTQGERILRPGAPLPEGMRGVAPGGVIGGVQGVGAGQQPNGRAGTRRVNPVGGIIGEGQNANGSRRAVGASGMSASEHPNGIYGRGNNRKSESRSDEDGLRWDPNNPWETAEGVDPIVMPQREQRVDPGPAIGLY